MSTDVDYYPWIYPKKENSKLHVSFRLRKCYHISDHLLRARDCAKRRFSPAQRHRYAHHAIFLTIFCELYITSSTSLASLHTVTKLPSKFTGLARSLVHTNYQVLSFIRRAPPIINQTQTLTHLHRPADLQLPPC